jgi:hypothetical protein
MEMKKETIASAFGLENEDELFKVCMDISLTTPNCSDILNKLVCSHLNTKEMIYCAFVCGRMQEMEVEMASLLFLKKRLMEIIDEKI